MAVRGFGIRLEKRRPGAYGLRVLRRLLLVPGLLACLACLTGVRGGSWRFQEPETATYESPLPRRRPEGAFLRARRLADGREIDLGSRVVVTVTDRAVVDLLSTESGFPVSRWFGPGIAVLDAPDPDTAAALAERWGVRPGVLSASPVRRHRAARHYDWAEAPNDPYFDRQWPMDASPLTGTTPRFPYDLNLRGAWAWGRGSGVVIAVADDGIDLTHPDLGPAGVAGLHENFFTFSGDARHTLRSQYHGTVVSGLAAARGGNGIGMAGAAPSAGLAGWVIFDAADNLPDTANLAAAFEFKTDRVAVQNHSWGNADLDVLEPTPIERQAISNAVTLGRGGRGVVMVRSSGNTRERSLFGRSGVGDANLDGFANDPAALTVGSVRRTGRVASYSTPGACLLVAAPGGEKSEGSEVFSTDPVGDAGLTTIASAGAEMANYASAPRIPAGTSFSAPEVSGTVAVLLGVRPELSAHDVALVLALAARQLDAGDPLLITNRAGLRFSPNTGYGVPDAGEAARVARSLPLRPARVRVTVSRTERLAVPDDGLRVVVTGTNIPPDLASIPASGGTGLHPDAPTADLPLQDAGQATAPIVDDLTGRAALIQRAPNDFAQKIEFAAAAGASFAVLWNNQGIDERLVMLRTDFVPIPAVLIGRTDGEGLRALLATNSSVRVRLELLPARQTFEVTESLAAEFVQVRLRMEHPRLADLRVTLVSPSGTRSVLHRAGASSNPQPAEWFYGSRAHLLEPTAGPWTLEVSDQATGSTGTVTGADLTLIGVPLEDSDADGLDDRWERSWWGDLRAGPRDDPDQDGRPNAVEQALGSDPARDDRPLVAEIAPISGDRLRMSWPGRPGVRYAVESAPDPSGPFTKLGDGWGGAFEGSFFLSRPDPARFLRVRTVP